MQAEVRAQTFISSRAAVTPDTVSNNARSSLDSRDDGNGSGSSEATPLSDFRSNDGPTPNAKDMLRVERAAAAAAAAAVADGTCTDAPWPAAVVDVVVLVPREGAETEAGPLDANASGLRVGGLTASDSRRFGGDPGSNVNVVFASEAKDRRRGLFIATPVPDLLSATLVCCRCGSDCNLGGS